MKKQAAGNFQNLISVALWRITEEKYIMDLNFLSPISFNPHGEIKFSKSLANGRKF
jgi:hypothetical protein